MNVIPTFILKALSKESLTLENGGLNSRDFIFVEDICFGLVQCGLEGNPGESYNLASGKETSILDLANLINEFTYNPTPPEIKPIREWDRSGKRFGSTEKSKNEIGFQSKTNIEEGLKITIKWTKTNKELIESNIKKHSQNI